MQQLSPQDMAADLFAQLENLFDEQETVWRHYAALDDLFRLTVDLFVGRYRLTFAGLFAKLDFFIKEAHIDAPSAEMIHTTRNNLKARKGLSEEELAMLLPHDIKSAAILVSRGWNTEIPDTLMHRLPKGARRHRWEKYNEAHLRCVVNSWDNNYLYVTEEQNGQELKVCYGEKNIYLTREGKGSWDYLRDLLRKGAQLGLVRLRFEEEECWPELIIFEPDYLVNVTTIASCFEAYGETPLASILNKMAPQPSSLAIHLGNLSGQFLDETVHGKHQPFGESVTLFFRKNALNMLACKELSDPKLTQQFYEEARQQQKNIDQLIGKDLPTTLGQQPDDVVLEPSFFSKVLGMQGRLDYLAETKAGTIIIEQKSGKGWGGMLRPLEKHVVQLLLYRALYIYEYERYSEELRHVMLLYSHFANGLVATAQQPSLLLRAIRLRNEIAWWELQMAEQGAGFLLKLSADKLNTEGLSGKFWNIYIKPRIDEVLQPIKKASPLERAYFLRMMKFIAREQVLAKMGNPTDLSSGFAAKWLTTLEEKKAAGNIYDGLTLTATRPSEEDEGEIGELIFAFDSEMEADTTNFRQGDIVVVYPYSQGKEPDVCRQMVTRASIKDITPTEMTLTLRNAQTSPQVFEVDREMRWAVEHDFFDASFSALYRGVHDLLTTTPRRRELLLCQREAETDKEMGLKGDYGKFDELVRRARQAKDVFLVIGPPGTGKTSFGLVNLLKEELLQQGSNILLLSFTNRAVDEICSKLVEEKIDFLRIGSPLSCEPAYHPYLFAERIKQMKKGEEIRQLLRETRVVCATTASLCSQLSLLQLKRFDLAIIDEASQLLEPHLLPLLCACNEGEEAIKRFVLIGDHKQLPAVVQQQEEESAVDDRLLKKIHLTNCRHSFFERMLRWFRNEEGYDPAHVYMLTRQGRMHPEIADFPNRVFYEGRLQAVPLPHQQEECEERNGENGLARILTAHRMVFVNAERPVNSVSFKTNEGEAKRIAAMVNQIYLLHRDTFDTLKTVGVIVPYRNQIATVRKELDGYGTPCLRQITIDTVERYQGSQRDYIIYGFTVQRPYQMDFLTGNVFVEEEQTIDRKLNVAMTRARRHLVLVGHAPLLRRDPLFRRLIDFVENKKGFVDVGCDDFCNGRF